MPQIYVIYRPEDTRKKSKEIIATLQKTYGEANVKFPNFDGYLDVYDIERTVQKTDFLLVVIGNYWADLVDEAGQNILASVYDPVHMAIATAINARKQVVPILIEGTSMPNPARLPRELRSLTRQEPIKLEKNVPISKSLNKGLKDIIKRESLIKIPKFVPQKTTPAKSQTSSRQAQQTTRSPQSQAPSRRPGNRSQSRINFNQARLLIVLVVSVIIVFIALLMVLPVSRHAVSEESVVTAVVATVAPTSTSTMMTETQDNSTVTESAQEFVIVTPTRQQITMNNAYQLIPIDTDVVSIASTDQFIFSQDESLFIFADTQAQNVQVIDVATNQVVTVLDTSPYEPLVLQLSSDETILHVLLSNGEVQSWGIPNQ